MAWTPKYPLDYSASGDDVDTFAQKYISEMAAIYSYLDRLRRLDASAGTTLDDVEAYQLKVNQTTNDIMIRNATNDAWIILGKMAANFGLTSALIGAVKNGIGATSLSVGLLANRPVVANSSEGDMYLTLDGDFYYFSTGTWTLLLSLDVTKLKNYDKVINSDMVSETNAPNKIMKTDNTGSIDASILGTAKGLAGFMLDTANLGDGKVIAYSASNGKLYFEVPGATSGGGSAVGVIEGRESLKVYSVGNKCYSSRLPSGTYLVCVTAGTSAEFQPDYDVVVNGKVADGSVEWRKETLSGVNVQMTSDTPLNQLDGDLLINTTGDNIDGGKFAILKFKNGTIYKPIYFESDNRELIESTGYGVVSGLETQAQAVPNYSVRVTAGVVHMPNGKRFDVSVVPTIAPTAADNTGTRKDLIYLSSVGNVMYLAGSLATAAIAGKRDYPISANAATGNTLTIGAVTLTAGTDFAVGATIANTLANIVAALNANTTITGLYTVSSSASTFTLTEKVSGSGNTPPAATTTGVLSITASSPITSSAAVYNDPVLPANGLAISTLTIAANQTTITATSITDNRTMKYTASQQVGTHNVDNNAHADLFAFDEASFIAKGLKVSAINGATVSISSGKAAINGKRVFFNGGDIALTLTKASMLYLKSAGTIGKVDAKAPLDFIDNNTVAMWIFNQAQNAHVPNSAVGKSSIAVANDLVPTGGLTVVDGWFDKAIQGDGTSGYYSGSNTTGFPTGANQFEINSEFTYYSGGGSAGNTQLFCLGNANSYIQIYSNSDYLYIFEMATGQTTNYQLKNGNTYLVTVKYDGSNLSVLVNGTLVFAITVTLAVTAGTIYVLSATSSMNFSKFIIHFLEIRNALRSDVLTGQLSNSLMLPCFYDKPGAAYPIISDADKALAYHEWKFDETSGTTVADSNTTSPLNGTATGTTIIDSPLGLGKARKISTTDKINVGSYSFGTEYTIISVFSYTSNGVENEIVRNYNGTIGTAFMVTTARKLELYQSGLVGLSSTTIEEGKPVFCAATVKSGIVSLYPNTKNPESFPATIVATASQPLNLFSANDINSSGINGTGEYIAIIPRALSQAEISKAYDALMTTGRRNIIDDVIPSDAVSLGFIRTNSSKIIEYNDADYLYGRREKSHGGNRKVFLGRKYFNGATTLKWNNPFGTRKIKLTFTWSSDSIGTLETNVLSYFSNSSDNYGIHIEGISNGDIIGYVGAKGACILNGGLATVGFIGCYAEVMEDFKGVDGK